MKIKNRSIPPTSWSHLGKRMPVILFFVSIVLSIFTTYYVTGHYIDADAASELVLAKQLAETGKILSRDWFYSTELRVLNTQLIYAPMFLLFSDWHLVRFFSALVLQLIYLLSYGFMLHQGGFKKTDFYFSASLLLLPVSVTYGRIMLYHCYYIPHISLSFVLVGLFLGFARGKALSLYKDGLQLAVMLLLSFIGGLGGIRQLMITHTPMLLVILLLCMVEDLHSSNVSKAAIFSKQKIQLLVVAILASFAAFLGYKVNADILANYYYFSNYGETALCSPSISDLSSILYGFLHQFGFRKKIALLSLLGILSLGGIVSAGFCLYLSFKNLRSHKAGADVRKSIISLFFLCFTVVMTTVFLITVSREDYCHVLYYVICLPWAVPLLLTIPDFFPSDIHPFNFKRLFSWAAVLILFVNGLANTAFFNGVDQFDQLYDGLSFREKDKASQMADLVDYLLENGYDAGYATFWESNIVTELSDGILPMVSVSFEDDEKEVSFLHYYTWLVSQWQMEAPKEKPFLIITTESKEIFEKSLNFPYCTCIYSDEYHCAYSIDDLEKFSETLNY